MTILIFLGVLLVVIIQIGEKKYKTQAEIIDKSPSSTQVKDEFETVNEETVSEETSNQETTNKETDNEETTKPSAAVDTKPPVITGAKDQIVFVGDSISYRQGVVVTDDIDEDAQLTIDNSKVNLQKPGEYKATYQATDSSGNSATEEVNITVREKLPNSVDEDELFEIVDGILDQIIDTSMSKEDKAWTIYQWVTNNVSYYGKTDKSDWITGAYEGFTKGSGDCFTYFAVAKSLLTRADIDNIDITRVGGRTNHYWHLVNLGEGWYHYDTTPQKDYLQVFMLTDEEVEAYTARSNYNYYTFDESLYPERGK